MKSVVFLGDGMADEPCAVLGGKTPLELASHPRMDELASRGRFGLTRTVPEGMLPGSDTANLSVFGYDPAACYTGRSPLEAVSMGVRLGAEDAAYRCNLVALAEADSFPDSVMLDYSGGEITQPEAEELLSFLRRELPFSGAELITGFRYRHCLVLRSARAGAKLAQPHEIAGRRVGDCLPEGANAELLRQLMEKAYACLRDHPVNQRRKAEGKLPANGVWFWGEGRRPALASFREKYGVENGAVISAVDLVRGIGLCAGLEAVMVPGATGDEHTDYAAKGRRAIEALESGAEFVYIHVEAPDECGHHGRAAEKIRSIEEIDGKIVGPVLDWLQSSGEDWSVLLMPDHPTPLEKRVHTADAVPFALYRSWEQRETTPRRFTEAEAAAAKDREDEAFRLMGRLLERRS